MSPRPAHCSGRPPGPPGATQPEKPEPGLSRASGRRKSKNRKRRCAVAGWKPSDLGEPRRTGARSQHRLPGGPSVPTPPPAATQFPQTDTHGARARGGARGLPRRVPWRPVPRKPSARKGAPKAPAHGARCAFPPEGGLQDPSVDPGTRTRAPRRHRGREAGRQPGRAPCISGITGTPV